MMKTEMTKKTSRIGLISSIDSFIRLTSSTLAPCQPPILFPFLSPVVVVTDLLDQQDKLNFRRLFTRFRGGGCSID
jgi:hypothetical protein